MSKLKQDEMAGMKGLSQTKPAGIIATSQPFKDTLALLQILPFRLLLILFSERPGSSLLFVYTCYFARRTSIKLSCYILLTYSFCGSCFMEDHCPGQRESLPLGRHQRVGQLAWVRSLRMAAIFLDLGVWVILREGVTRVPLTNVNAKITSTVQLLPR